VTLWALAVCIACQLCLVGGQICLKHGMNATHHAPKPWFLILSNVAIALVLMSVWFFLWLGLLQDWELSRLFPFEALSPPLLVLGAWLFLRERIARVAWVGIVLIAAGVLLVSQS
jgi:uncharacterized membrane protein